MDEDMAAFFGKKDTGPVKQVVVRGANLWEKKQVTISGERIAKVDRVASQVAKLIVELREASVPVHNSLCLSEYLESMVDSKKPHKSNAEKVKLIGFFLSGSDSKVFNELKQHTESSQSDSLFLNDSI